MRNCNMQNCNMPECMMRESRMPEARMANEMSGYIREENPCGCDSFPIGMAYVPWQEFKNIYDLERGLEAGTIFAELDKPFLGRRAFRR